MRKELLGATIIFGLGTGGLFAQDVVTPEDPAADAPAVEAPATDDGMGTDTTTTTTTIEPTEGDQAADPAAPAGEPGSDATMDGAATDGLATEGAADDPMADTLDTDTVTSTGGTGEGVVTTTENGEPVEQVADTHLLASEIIGATIVQPDGTSIGEISDAVMSPDGYMMESVIVDVGGFLGIGTKTAAIPVDELTPPDADGYVQISLTREEIEALPDFVGRVRVQDEMVPADPMADPLAPAPAP